jgi:hypothetical protein
MNLERIEVLHLALLLGAAAIALATGWLQLGSLLLGGGVMAANFRLLKLLVRRALRPGRGRGLAMVAFTAKFGLFLGLLAMLFRKVPVEGASFAVGATLLLSACVIEALRTNTAIPREGTV